jgi:NAD(P)H dehydrogenase (quinone)
MSRPIGVTGATGSLGGRVASLLSARGLIQRLIVRDTERAPLLIAAEVRHAAGYADGLSMRAAFQGLGTLFLVPADEAADRVEQHRTVVDAAVAAGVERIVYVSLVGPAPDATSALVRDHWATEEHVRASRVSWTFARRSLYLDVLPRMVGADGVLRGPAGEGSVAAVARDDVARAVAELVAGEGHAGRTYELTGPRAITLGEAAAAMGELTGRPIRFEDEAPEGAPESWVSACAAIAAGELDVVSDDVRRLTGREPAGIEDWLRDRPDALAHVEA